MMDLGARLRGERMRQNISLEQVEQDTKIRTAYLKALETDDFKNLPAKVYAVGFMKRYSGYLGFSPKEQEELIQAFKAEAFPEEVIQEIPSNLTRSSPQELAKRKINPWVAVLGIVFLVLATVAGRFLVEKLGNAPEIAEEIPEVIESLPDLAEPIPEKLTELKLDFTVKSAGKCWISVTADGVNVFTGTLYEGDNQTFTGKESVRFRVGNAGSLLLIVNGEEAEPLGAPGMVVEQEYRLVLDENGENTLEHRVY